MKNKRNRYELLLLAGALCLTAVGAVPAVRVSASEEASENNSEESWELEADFITPAELAFPVLEEYEVPFMGLLLTPPEELLAHMEGKDVAMLMDQIFREDSYGLQYGYLSWNTITEEQWNAELDFMNDDVEKWEGELGRIGTIGVYETDLTDRLDELTGCDEHKELGESADGNYKYYLSIRTEADEELAELVRGVKTEIIEMETMEMDSAEPEDGGQDSGEAAQGAEADAASLGEFTTQDIDGNTWTQEMFRDYDLTMINVFATWCSPCVAEIPDLEKLHKEMEDQGVNVVGVVLDVLDEKGEISQESLERAQLLAEKTGATYPILIPDAGYLNGRLIGIEAIPETFFVDSNGNIVGETYSGSGSLEDWREVVEKELKSLTASQADSEEGEA